jgi:hypothetical protein
MDGGSKMNLMPYYKKENGDTIFFHDAEDFVPDTERPVYAVKKPKGDAKVGHPCFAYFVEGNIHDADEFFVEGYLYEEQRNEECTYDKEKDIWYVNEGWYEIYEDPDSGDEVYYRVDIERWMERPL